MKAIRKFIVFTYQKHRITLINQVKLTKIAREDTGMVLHKDSKFYQSWQNFKENNAYINSKTLKRIKLIEEKY